MKTAQTEKILFGLLDYQKFDGDAALDALIAETERRARGPAAADGKGKRNHGNQRIRQMVKK